MRPTERRQANFYKDKVPIRLQSGCPAVTVNKEVCWCKEIYNNNIRIS